MSIAIEHFGHVTQLTLDRPDAANAVSIEVALGIADAIETFATDDNARVLVVTGAGSVRSPYGSVKEEAEAASSVSPSGEQRRVCFR